MNKPILPDKPIEHEVGGSYGSGFVIGAIDWSGSILFQYVFGDSVTQFKGRGTWMNGASADLLSFVTNAEAHFKPLVELPFTEKVLESMMGAYYGIDPKRVASGNIYSMKNVFEAHGFKLKEV